VRHRLARLMASGLRRHTAAQASAAMSGSHIVTFIADSEPDAERAKRIIQRFHPVGIEDRPSEWDHDPAVMPSACPPGTEPGSLLYRSRDNSPYFGTQNAGAPPIGNTFEEPMSDGGRWSGAEDRPSRPRRPAPPSDAVPENLEDRAP
ncbi:MAG: hypothetical protein WCC39_01260, partial [Telluria sp.]